MYLTLPLLPISAKITFYAILCCFFCFVFPFYCGISKIMTRVCSSVIRVSLFFKKMVSYKMLSSM